jgi:caspase domain-containing protein/L,D-transpeptidase-like protein
MHLKVLFWSVLIGLIALDAFPVDAADRVALVIGNDAYPSQKVGSRIVKWDLNGIPIEDARKFADLLRSRLGFDEVDVGENLGIEAMLDRLRSFRKKMAGAKVALFYYSGHGAEHGGENFLVPVDNPLVSPTDNTINLRTHVIDLMDAAGDNVTKLILLDACRNDPFKSLTKGPNAESADGGLASPRKTGGGYPQGMIIGYAAEPGGKAATGKGPTSIYTTSLLKYLAQPGLEFEQALRKAGAEVKRLTKNGQIPWRNSNADDVDLVLLPVQSTTPAKRTLVTSAPTPKPAPSARGKKYLKDPNEPSYWDGDSVGGSPSIVVHLEKQAAYFYKDRQLVGISEISSGRPEWPTPKGKFKIIEKVKESRSPRFGDYVDKDGNVVKEYVDREVDPMPTGTTFRGGIEPYFLRLFDHIGFHAGYLPGYNSAVDGCMKMPEFMAENFFKAAPIGTPILITD